MHRRPVTAPRHSPGYLMRLLLHDGLTQSDIARELGVTRQAIQKMLAC